MSVKQQYVIYQVQLQVISGEANFTEPLPTGQKVVTPSDGWVALDTIFDQLVEEDDPEMSTFPAPTSGPNCRGQLHYRPNERRRKAKAKAKAAADNEDNECGECGEEGDEEDRKMNRSSLDRAKTTFRFHQLNTLRRLEKTRCMARLRLMPFEQMQPIMQTDKSYNVDIYDEVEP